MAQLCLNVSSFRWFCFLVLCTLLSATRIQAKPFLYFTSSTSDTVSVVDAKSLKVIYEIRVGREPFGLAFSPDGHRAFVANAQSREVSVIDTSRHRLVQNIAVPSELPVWVAAAPDGTYVYVTNERSDDVTVIAAASNSVVARIPVGRGPAGIVISPDSRYAYVANEGSSEVSLVDLQREQAIKRIPVGKVPQGLAMSRDGVWVYVANFGNNSVSVIATAQNEVVAEIPVGEGPVALALSPDAHGLYSGNFKAGSLSIVDTSERREVATLETGAETFGVGVSPSGREVYVASARERQVVVVDVQRRAVTQRASLGEGPYKLAVAPEAPSMIRKEHLWMILFVLLLTALIHLCFARRESLTTNHAGKLAAVFVFALLLRCAGLSWGIPVYDAETVKAAPELRVSFHPDEDNFLWNLVRVRPRQLDFAVTDFHWGTLQYHLIELALLLAQVLHLVASPWRESFVSFHPIEYTRVFVTGRLVSAVLGSCSIFLAFGIGRRLYNRSIGLVSAMILAVLPLHVVKSHDLTADVTMVFFVMLALWRLLITIEEPSARNQFLAGLATGLGVTAKYTAIFLLPAAIIVFLLKFRRIRARGAWFYPGVMLGFVIGEPYALVHPQQFWQSVKPYLQFAKLPDGAVPALPALMALQLKNLAIFGLGIPLAVILVTAGFRALVRRLHSEKRAGNSVPRLATEDPLAASSIGHLLWALAVILFGCSILFLRQPMLRYTLPVGALAIFPAARCLWEMSRTSIGRWVGVTTLLFTGGLSLLQIRILTQPHPGNQAFAWVERHVPAGASIQKGWPELPPLNPNKFLITNFFSQPRMADFLQYFVDEAGKPHFADYVVIDNLPTLDIPELFFDQLRHHYTLVAEFYQRPRLSTFELPEWDPPHDWKYSHPEIRVYRRK